MSVRSLVTAGMACLIALPAAAQDVAALKKEAAGIMQAFGGALKAELTAAMKEGGPAKAIEACNAKAPAIAADAAAKSGWDVGRTSHRIRNAASAPDAYESKVMADFLARLEKGEKAEDLVRAEVVEENGGKVFRMVKAIPTADLCLHCHGSDLAPEVKARLDALYPGDAARGFKVGDMRGVFTLKKRL